MDYVSTISIHDGSDTEGTVSMNRIFKHKGYRFYQSGYDADGKGSTLYVSHDPIGIAVTYTGYLLLFLSMILFFFEKKSARNPLLRKGFLQCSYYSSYHLRHCLPKTNCHLLSLPVQLKSSETYA